MKKLIAAGIALVVLCVGIWSSLRTPASATAPEPAPSMNVAARSIPEDQPAATTEPATEALPRQPVAPVNVATRRPKLQPPPATPLPPPVTLADDGEVRFQAAAKRDLERFGPETLQKIEDQYTEGIRNAGFHRGRVALSDLISRYPESNRAGCAAPVLARDLANAGELEDASAYLDFVIKGKHPGVFKNDTPALCDSLLLAGEIAVKQGDQAAAKAAWSTLVSEHSNETDPDGNTYGTKAAELLQSLGKN